MGFADGHIRKCNCRCLIISRLLPFLSMRQRKKGIRHIPSLPHLECMRPTAARPSTIEEIQLDGVKRFGRRPCRWQSEIALQLINGQSLVSISATGSGKSFVFWLPMPYEDGLTLIIVPLKTLGQQLADESSQRGFRAVSVTAELLGETPTVLEVCG